MNDQPAYWDATRPWGTTPDAAAIGTPDGDDGLREQLYVELDAHGWGLDDNRCVCGWSPSDDTSMDQHRADALMPAIRDHIAAAVQAERERIGARLASIPDEYYPQDVFGGPFSTDESRLANEALREHGLTIDRISANVMRHAYRVAASIAREEPTDDRR